MKRSKAMKLIFYALLDLDCLCGVCCATISFNQEQSPPPRLYLQNQRLKIFLKFATDYADNRNREKRFLDDLARRPFDNHRKLVSHMPRLVLWLTVTTLMMLGACNAGNSRDVESLSPGDTGGKAKPERGLLRFKVAETAAFDTLTIDLSGSDAANQDVKKSFRLRLAEISEQPEHAMPLGTYRVTTNHYDEQNQLLRSSSWCNQADKAADEITVKPGINSFDVSHACAPKTSDDPPNTLDPLTQTVSPVPIETQAPGSGTPASPATPPATATTPEKPLNDGSGGIRIIGDSLFTHGNHIPRALQQVSGLTIVNHAVLGSWMRDLSGQYQRIRGLRPKIIIMDGGGNDMLGQRDACSNALTPQCRATIENAMNLAKDLWRQMAQDGVHAVIYMSGYYPEPGRWNASTSNYATQGSYTEAVDFAANRVKAECAAQTIRCIVVDARTAVQGMVGYTDDGIHPSFAASSRIADAIWQAMQQNGIR